MLGRNFLERGSSYFGNARTPGSQLQSIPIGALVPKRKRNARKRRNGFRLDPLRGALSKKGDSSEKVGTHTLIREGLPLPEEFKNKGVPAKFGMCNDRKREILQKMWELSQKENRSGVQKRGRYNFRPPSVSK